MAPDPGLVRVGDWWNDKIPHLVAVAALGIASTGQSATSGMSDLSLFLTSAMGIAAFGHVLNDITDVDVDRAAGKPNRLGMLPPGLRLSLLGLCLTVGLLPWVWLPRSELVLGLLAAEVVLLALYSLPPFRLKDREGAGVLADACYAYAVPLVLTVAVFFGESDRASVWVLCAVALLGMLIGLRGIIWHQVADEANDRASGVRSLVLRIGRDRSVRLTDRLAPAEFALLALGVAAASVATGSVALAVSCAIYVPCRLVAVQILWEHPLAPGSWRSSGYVSQLLGYGAVTGLMDRWLPIASLVLLAWREPLWWIPAIIFALAFENVLSQTIRTGGRSFFRSWLAVAVEPAARSYTRSLDRQRAASTVEPTDAGARPASPPTERRWVFVLCGGAVHTHAMRNAVRHLRLVSDLDIWVLTDVTRNEVQVDSAEVDCVIDVRTPDELDDHEAAIWLKTSVHRHLPDAQWCYLDTDIVAIDTDVDSVFEYRDGPVAFASDLPQAGNTVENFSPFAMTCGCLDEGRARCHHLCSQLESRLGTVVPSTWCHWNGGVFVFGSDAGNLLDRWHELAVASFDWLEWRTRDQGALIAAVWQLGLQDVPRLPQKFNFIVADPWQNNVHVDRARGWSLSPAGPWIRPQMLHLFQPGLDAPDWSLTRDVELPIVRRMLRVRCVDTLIRWRGEFAGWRAKQYWAVRIAIVKAYWAVWRRLSAWGWSVRTRIGNSVRATYWRVRTMCEWSWYRVTKLPERLRPHRVVAAIRRRLHRGSSGSNEVGGG